MLSSQSIVHLIHCLLLHGRENIAVDIHRHADLIMPQKLLHYLWMHTHSQEHGSYAMSQVMKTDVRQASLFQYRLKPLVQAATPCALPGEDPFRHVTGFS